MELVRLILDIKKIFYLMINLNVYGLKKCDVLLNIFINFVNNPKESTLKFYSFVKKQKYQI